MPVISSRAIFGNLKEPVYATLGRLEPGLLVDVGASDGHKSSLMLTASPQSKLVAVEPFPANVAMLRDNLGADARVQIIDRAVTDDPGPVNLAVSSTVKSEGGARKQGYSSLGFITETAKEGYEVNVSVATIGLDEVLDGQSARLVKIDVQGGEYRVLQSAKDSFAAQRIDMIFMEFSGNAAELRFFSENDYIVFDNYYLLVPKGEPNTDEWDLINHNPFKLSNGLNAHHAWPKQMATTDDLYCQFFKEQLRNGWIQTDLICVSRAFLPEFMTAAVSVNIT